MTEHEIMIKVVDQQLEFLENRAKELGLSKEDLVKNYITKAINNECEKIGQEQRLSLILSIKGKYASVLTNSEEFARRKGEEILMDCEFNNFI